LVRDLVPPGVFVVTGVFVFPDDDDDDDDSNINFIYSIFAITIEVDVILFDGKTSSDIKF
jgi:hypothetical protein